MELVITVPHKDMVVLVVVVLVIIIQWVEPAADIKVE